MALFIFPVALAQTSVNIKSIIKTFILLLLFGDGLEAEVGRLLVGVGASGPRSCRRGRAFDNRGQEVLLKKARRQKLAAEVKRHFAKMIKTVPSVALF